MLSNIILIAVLVLLVAGVVGLWYWRRRPRTLKTEHFQKRWQALQLNLRDKQTWPEVVSQADKLLDEALKKKHIAGKNMGERLVKAQRMLTDNDSVWFGHKLRGQIEHDPNKKLKESDVKDALIGIRQALKDIGALPESKPKSKTSPLPEIDIPAKPSAQPTKPKEKPSHAPKPKPTPVPSGRPKITARPKPPVRRRKI